MSLANRVRGRRLRYNPLGDRVYPRREARLFPPGSHAATGFSAPGRTTGKMGIPLRSYLGAVGY